jgi:hypothetical protein
MRTKSWPMAQLRSTTLGVVPCLAAMAESTGARDRFTVAQEWMENEVKQNKTPRLFLHRIQGRSINETRG